MTTSANKEGAPETLATPSTGLPTSSGATRARAELLRCLGDMHAVVVNGLQTINLQLEFLLSSGSNSSPHVIGVVRDVVQLLKEHEARLDTRAKALGGKVTRPLKDAVLAVLGAAAGLIDAVRPKELSKTIRDDYGYLCYLSVGYLELFTIAGGVGDHATALIAEQCCRDTAHHITETAKLLPMLVLQEMQKEGLAVAAVQDQCVRLITELHRQESCAQPGAASPPS